MIGACANCHILVWWNIKLVWRKHMPAKLESLFNSLLKPRSSCSNFSRMSNKGMGCVNYGGPTIIVQLHTSYTLKEISHYCKRSIDPVFYNLRPSFFIFSNFHFFTLMNLLSPPPYMSYVSHTNELH